MAVLTISLEISWRRRPDLNRGWRFCRPLPYHLATAPLGLTVVRAGEAGRVYSQRRQRADRRVRNFICRAVRGMLPSTLRRVTPAHRVLIATLDILRTKAGSP